MRVRISDEVPRAVLTGALAILGALIVMACIGGLACYLLACYAVWRSA